MIQLFPPRLEGNEPKKNEARTTKRVINTPIYDNYNFTNKGKVKRHIFKGILRHITLIFGEKVTEITENILSYIFMISLLGVFCTLFIPLVYPAYNSDSDPILFPGTIMIVSLILLGCFTSALEYYRDSICRLCGEKFACEEIKEPTIKEISKENEYSVTIHRYWKCKFCDNMDIREGREDIVAWKGDWKSKRTLKKIKCENCKEKNVIEEFRKSDVKSYGDKVTTRNYYKCSNCGYIKIKEIEVIAPSSYN